MVHQRNGGTWGDNMRKIRIVLFHPVEADRLHPTGEEVVDIVEFDYTEHTDIDVEKIRVQVEFPD